MAHSETQKSGGYKAPLSEGVQAPRWYCPKINRFLLMGWWNVLVSKGIWGSSLLTHWQTELTCPMNAESQWTHSKWGHNKHILSMTHGTRGYTCWSNQSLLRTQKESNEVPGDTNDQETLSYHCLCSSLYLVKIALKERESPSLLISKPKVEGW